MWAILFVLVSGVKVILPLPEDVTNLRQCINIAVSIGNKINKETNEEVKSVECLR